MKFATKLSLGCITLLSCALCAAGLILTGKSFSGSLETTRAAMQAQQAKEKYTLERCIFTAAETNTLFSTNTMFENYTLATAAQQYAEQTADANSGLALWVNGAYTLYSNLPTALPRAVQMQAVSNGADDWQLAHCAGYWYLLLSQPLDTLLLRCHQRVCHAQRPAAGLAGGFNCFAGAGRRGGSSLQPPRHPAADHPAICQ